MIPLYFNLIFFLINVIIYVNKRVYFNNIIENHMVEMTLLRDRYILEIENAKCKESICRPSHPEPSGPD